MPRKRTEDLPELPINREPIVSIGIERISTPDGLLFRAFRMKTKGNQVIEKECHQEDVKVSALDYLQTDLIEIFSDPNF